MRVPPLYFERVRQRAMERWDNLERDQGLAGPWHQLFKQVQSPRHVLSELLQNADDAGATRACTRIEDGDFVFVHDGEDFKEEHFASLCEFGYSNKRALHTIGFRGIGFKSVFSLGDTIRVTSPSLSVVFNRERFTEPVWKESSRTVSDLTEIRVCIRDTGRRRQIEDNFRDWTKSPASLLFFQNLRRVEIADKVLEWSAVAPGSVEGTERLALNGHADNEILIIRSGLEPFPDEALAEIREERLLGAEDSMEFPPCTVEVVLGARPRLYVVLPTGVETALPFACNAPFIQDPARVHIKDPDSSATNRWLLQRIGRLVASVMLEWVRDETLDLSDRSLAYGLFPDVDREDTSLPGRCAAIVEEAFADAIDGHEFVLTNEGSLVGREACVALPSELMEVWPEDGATSFLDHAGRSALSRFVSSDCRQRLINWRVCDDITRSDVIAVLQSKAPPRPSTWRRLVRLWAYVAPALARMWSVRERRTLRIVPVHGKDVLCAADEVVRLGEKRILDSDQDWEFLQPYVLGLNRNWLAYLADSRRDEDPVSEVRKHTEAAYDVLTRIGLDSTSDVNAMMERIACRFFDGRRPELSECLTIAQIAAKLGATVDESFRFVAENGSLRKPGAIVCHLDGGTSSLFSGGWLERHSLNSAYFQAFTSCTREEWNRWVTSTRAGLWTFVPLTERETKVWGRTALEAELKRRGFEGTPDYHYKSREFRLVDWDFDEGVWKTWNSLAADDPTVWPRIVEHILEEPPDYWKRARSVDVVQVSTAGTPRRITHHPILPSWIARLRELLCLRDVRGFTHVPSDLLLRTPATEPFIDVEPFLDRRFDNESNRPLLEMLGVRDAPMNPSALLDRLRALATAQEPPVREVDKWYVRLDQMLEACATEEFTEVRSAFNSSKLILSADGRWCAANGVFLSEDEEELPGTPTIRASVGDLALWRKIGVADRPSPERVMEWLKQLPSGSPVPQSDQRLVRRLLKAYQDKVWRETGHWLNLAGEWVSIQSLKFGLTMQSLVAWSHLYEGIKQETADFQMLPVNVAENSPFSVLPPLGIAIENRPQSDSPSLGSAVPQPWLQRLGEELQRVAVDDEDDRRAFQVLGGELSQTSWQSVARLEIVPYIDGTPVGTARSAQAVWDRQRLYVKQGSLASVARAVAQELGRFFADSDVVDAIKLCFDRDPAFVTEYMEAHFTLAPRAPTAVDRPPNEPADSSPPWNQQQDTQGDGDFRDDPTNSDSGATEESPLQLDDDWNSPDDEGTPVTYDDDPSTRVRRGRHRSHVTAGIMDRFALERGFSKRSSDCFGHSDGSAIKKTSESTFPWERLGPGGDAERYYYALDLCLEAKPLELPAELWGLLQRFPQKYALILADPAGKPIELDGARLQWLVESGRLTLHPATFRFVYSTESGTGSEDYRR